MSNVTISTILKGVTPGRLQSVGYMQVIPLISDIVDDSISPPNTVSSATRDYGHLVVTNRSEKTTILPFGAGFVSDQSAQNHATTKAVVMKKGQIANIHDAACIQQSQGGYIRDGFHNMTILPWSVKEAAMVVKDQRSYQKLWPSIAEFNKSVGLQNRGHLEDYLNKFKSELDTFISEFEVVPNQVGAIFLMNGYVMGIEKAPNYQYWKSIWKPLIRECYGSLAIQYRKAFGKNPAPPKTRVPLKSVNISSLQDIAKALDSARKKEETIAKGIVRKFVKDRFKVQMEGTSGSTTYRVKSLSNKQFTGQITTNSDRVVYASLVATSNWVKNQEYNEADDFKI